MAEKKAATKSSGKSTGRSGNTTGKFTADERAAMKERAKELKEEARRDADRAEGERVMLEKIAEMKGSDRAMAERIREIVGKTAPELSPKTWYGMPAWAKDGKIVCFFQSAAKFNARYATFGFDQAANVDEGSMWPTSWALTKLTDADEKKIAALVKKSVR
jgi:uncharacterized protein YdhG (YjbR/CyaY superfamily)